MEGTRDLEDEEDSVMMKRKGVLIMFVSVCSVCRSTEHAVRRDRRESLLLLSL